MAKRLLVNPVKLLELADGLRKQIGEKMNSGTARQRPTTRHLLLIESMQKEGRHLMKIQAALRGLTYEAQAGFVPESLQGISQRTQVETLIRNATMPSEAYDAPGFNGMIRAGIETERDFAQARADLLQLIPSEWKEGVRRRDIETMERDLTI